MKPNPNLLVFADSEHDADMLYAVGMFVPDPFVYLRVRGRHYLVISDLEIDRARAHAPHCHVISLNDRQQRLRRRGIKQPGTADVIQSLLREKRVRSVRVPGSFPLQLATDLRARHIGVTPSPGLFFPEREVKSRDEVRKITEALRTAEAGMGEAMRVLRASRVHGDHRLFYNGAPLTSEKLRAIIDSTIIERGALASHTIVAGGAQACNPHEPGHGPLRAHLPIIIDIFPRSQTTGYFGDITRTVVRGRASDALHRLYDTVYQGQAIAFKRVRAGVCTADVHQAVVQFFDQQGFQTGRHAGHMQGFFHGTGHGLGLEIHEAPRVGATSTGHLKAGHVVTVEPGLYYPGLGGVRLEDVALVTDRAPRNLTRFEKVFEL